MTLSREQALIQRVFAPLAEGDDGAAGLKDDAASYAPKPGMDVVITVDSLVADVHFLSTDDPLLVAKKALRVNLSDLAAKGAKARGYVLAIALSEDQDEAWIQRFADGLAEDQSRFGCTLMGGDTVATPGPLTLTVTAFGDVPQGRILRRGGGRAGDIVYVSGTIGDSALGLAALQGRIETDDDDLRRRYWLPEPRVDLVPALLAHAHAAMDVSDGLVGDLGLLCWASGLTARIDAQRIPLGQTATRLISKTPGLLETCLTGGDDYEILCSVPPEDADHFEAAADNAGVKVTAIGDLVPGTTPPQLIGAQGEVLHFAQGSYSHFK
ncbi:thiamine-monophosphate kinase [Rhodoligotrophos appendicifer]|uniref:thiamine-phosphate kinase n=1 Tax=Rhodoligotrophos appendicifer TaxID=987056 RepID=UPI001186493E|nr:thiamine-phosphate kinase [Rhodoligotrophos appendicifer]